MPSTKFLDKEQFEKLALDHKVDSAEFTSTLNEGEVFPIRSVHPAKSNPIHSSRIKTLTIEVCVNDKGDTVFFDVTTDFFKELSSIDYD